MTGPDAAPDGVVVIDASVGLTWVLPEPGSEAALRLRERVVAGGVAVYVPDLFWAEAANVLWRLTRGAAPALETGEARALLEMLRAAPLATEAVGPLAGRALEVACATGATAYDAAYIVVAEVMGARLWTADRQLMRAVEGTEWSPVVALL